MFTSEGDGKSEMAMQRGAMWNMRLLISLAATAIVTLSLRKPATAIPAFARGYGTSCRTCHIDFPKLNDFGKTFKDAAQCHECVPPPTLSCWDLTSLTKYNYRRG
jgi:hypothetical protein